MSVEDFTERRQFRGRETISACVCGRPFSDGHEHPELAQLFGVRDFTPDELHRADQALQRWHRHTVDLAGPAPVHVEDEALAFERGWRRAKVSWAVLVVLGVGYVVWRLVK